MRTIGIYINTDKQNAYETAFRCVKYLLKQGITPMMLHNQYAEIGGIAGVKACFKDQFFSAPDCIVVLGGDGTLLGIARQASAYETPICGINLGKLGFLTNGDAGSYEEILQLLIDGDYTLDKRSMIVSTVKKLNGEYESQVALNDLVVKAIGIRMIKLTVKVDGALLDEYSGDGVILATPTGSTASAAQSDLSAPAARQVVYFAGVSRGRHQSAGQRRRGDRFGGWPGADVVKLRRTPAHRKGTVHDQSRFIPKP